MERAGLNRRPILLLVALLASLAAAIPAGRWLGTPRPISGTAPVEWPKGPPLPLPSPSAVTRSEARRIGAKEWREMPLESGRKALAALALNHEILRPADVTFFDPRPQELEIRFTTQDGYTVRIAMSFNGSWISGHEAKAPDGRVSNITGDYVLEASARREVMGAVAPALSVATSESQK